MKILKRNQIIISVLALMLITVGYMSYTSNMHNVAETGALMDSEKMAGIGDAKLVNSNSTVDDNNGQNAQDDNSEKQDEQNEHDKNETAESGISDQSENSGSSASSISTSESSPTSASNYGTDYFISSRLERDKMYSQMLETYQGLLESTTISPEQKNISTQEITNINNRKNSIMIAENLIKNLGFEDVVIFVNDTSTSVIVKAEKLEEADIAKIQNIVCREIGVEAESIHISLK